ETAELLSPKRVTLHLQNQTSQRIVDELQQLTGYKIEFEGTNENKLYTLDCDNLPFWEALDQTCQLAGLVMSAGHRDTSIHLDREDRYTSFVDYRGAFRLSADHFSQNKSIVFSTLPKHTGAAQRSESLSFSFTVAVEPRIPLMSV